MLKRINGHEDESGAGIRIGEARYPSPFVSGLEYSAPARGVWNIVHTGMLIPEAHEIFVCAAGCLRGVVLTAAEMNAQDRFSTIAIREHNVLDGDMEDLILDGVADIIEKLGKRPPAVLLYTSCIHHFIGCDLKLVYKRLRERFPDIRFTDCYMNPIMRKSGLTPDQLMRRQLYSLLEERERNPKAVNIIGNNLPTQKTSELVRIIEEAGYTLHEITSCRTFEEYQEMAESVLNISYNPAAKAAGSVLQRRLHQKHLYLPVSYDYDEIRIQLNTLATELGAAPGDYNEEIACCEESLDALKRLLGETPVAIDYTATMRPLGLARLLLAHGFRVERVYLDAVSPEEKEDFEWLKVQYPDLMLYATVHAKMRLLSRECQEKTLAIGQKAAYFTGTDYFVNMVEGGGLYGYDGILQLLEDMKDSFLHRKNTKELIQIKGLGCGCCA